MKRALYPGSFDPLTLGHINIIERALDIFDAITVLVALNPQKKPLFSVEQNLAMIREATQQWPQVDVDHASGLVVQYGREHGISHAVRGLRAVTDFEVEFSMALTNRELSMQFDTVFLMTSLDYMYLHSSVVRQVAEMGGDVTKFVPGGVERRLRQHYGHS
ncbi:MAG: pantetheine-phosphate adenylyltransferase [Gemmatimonadetes bacterium]|jgi:pantetheine-phosphate adenylyltransferase|nr:pantetheine-phosphate adenylyltransferase [Gemmatimonadota bacterium]